jgi:hypothetical protein
MNEITVKQALNFVQVLLEQKGLSMNDNDRRLFPYIWNWEPGVKSAEQYKQIAEQINLNLKYSHTTIQKDHADHLRTLLTEALEQKITNKTLKEVVQREWNRRSQGVYVERPPLEKDCYELIKKPGELGELIRIKAPQKMGKTLLLNTVLYYARSKGYQIVSLSYDDTSVLANYETFLKWFCLYVSDSLKPQKTIDEYWQEGLGLHRNYTKYFEEILLSSIDSDLVIAMDNFDILFEFEDIFRQFCRLIRSWYSKARGTDNSSSIWKKLQIIIVYSTQFYPKLDKNHSPLNVGTSIELKGFTQEQVENLVKNHQLEQKFKNQDKFS